MARRKRTRPLPDAEDVLAVVLVGSRQDGREWSPSVVRVEPRRAEEEQALRRQLRHGRYPTSDPYGSGPVGHKIARQIGRLEPFAQKHLHWGESGQGAVGWS